MSPGLLIGVALGYFPGMFILLRLLTLLQKKMWVERKAEKAPKTKAALAALPKPIWKVWKPRIAFTMKDGRPMKIGKKEGAGPPNRVVFFGLFVAGLLISLLGAAIGMYLLIPIGYFMFFMAIIFAVRASKSVLATRASVLKKMFEIGSSKGLISNEYADTPEKVIKVVEWNDYVKPQKVEYQIRTEFSAAGEEAFMQQFNQIFGNETAWVPSDDPETGKSGWNYDEGVGTFHAVPPLPLMAPWDEHYVLAEGVAWSFFPLALGVENGIELVNPKTGETENVLGFDLSGEQAKVGQKAGVKVSPTITTSPMCLAGDTLVALADGTFRKIRQMSQDSAPVKVLTFDENSNISHREMRGTCLTRKNAPVWKISFSDDAHVFCTPDHEFRLVDGSYIEASKLAPSDKISSSTHESISVKSAKYHHQEDVYCGEVDETHNFIVAADANGTLTIGVKNCLVGGGTGGGKSLSSDTPVWVIDNNEDHR